MQQLVGLQLQVPIAPSAPGVPEAVQLWQTSAVDAVEAEAEARCTFAWLHSATITAAPADCVGAAATASARAASPTLDTSHSIILMTILPV